MYPFSQPAPMSAKPFLILMSVVFAGCQVARPPLPNETQPVVAGLELITTNRQDSDEGIPDSNSIEQYVQLGLARNPAIAEAYYRLLAAEARIP